MNEKNVTKDMLDEEFVSEMEALKGMPLGTDEYRITVDGICKLRDKSSEIEKRREEREDRLAKDAAEREDRLAREKIEREDRLAKEALDREERLAKEAAENRDRMIRNSIAVAGIVIPTVTGSIIYLKALHDELDGRFPTTTTAKSIFQGIGKIFFKK